MSGSFMIGVPFGVALSYLAIARKYRPATFEEIVGQAHVTRTLRNALANRRIHHAYLFCGARGVGKTTAARAFARALTCERGPTPDPCGVCSACREVTNGSSPDMVEIDGASNNGVDDVRELRDNVAYLPTRGSYKIYLVDEVHMLSKAAFNALLKTLEEPPRHVVFLFATTEPTKIPETILSRVQRFDFKRIPLGAVVERLASIAEREGVRISEPSLRRIARAGEGSMRDAQSLLDKVISFAGAPTGPGMSVPDAEVTEILGLIDRALLHEALAGLVRGEPARVLQVVDTVYGYGYELAQFSEELMEVVRNATFLRLSPESRRYVDLADDEVERLAAVVDGVEPERLQRVFSALVDVHDAVSRSPRPRLVLEMAVARLATPAPTVPAAALVARLEELERRAAGPKKATGAGPERPGPRRT